MPTSGRQSDQLDRATANRLAKLRSMPVDSHRLEAAIRSHFPRQQPVMWRLFRPAGAIAASLLVCALIAALVVSSSGGQVLASPAQMAQVHQELLTDRAVTKVSSIDEAAKALSPAASDSPALPATPGAHVMACCMKSIQSKQVACVLLQTDGRPITISVARSSDMKLPEGPGITRDGVQYFMQSHGSLNMVTTRKHGRWICLIGEFPSDRLIDLAARLQF